MIIKKEEITKIINMINSKIKSISDREDLNGINT